MAGGGGYERRGIKDSNQDSLAKPYTLKKQSQSTSSFN